MNKCVVCKEDAPNLNDRYFVVPGHIMVPNCYALCDRHRGFQFVFEDFYNDDGTRKEFNLANKAKVVKATLVKKPEYIGYLKEITKALNRIAEELAIMNERALDD